jgi:RNA polymerase sporulation-specific sigma factor
VVILFAQLLELLSHAIYLFLHVTGGGTFPRALSAAQEKKCLEEMAQGSQAARQKLIEHNLRLVAHIIKKYYASQNDQEDLISIGTIGLIKAVDTFDASKGIRLSSYASRCIENEILMFFRSGKKSAQDVSLNEPIDTDKDGNALTILDTMAMDDTIVDSIDVKMKSEKLYRFLQSALTQRERKVVCRRYGLCGFRPQPQRVVAKHLGISRSYISRIEKKALEKLRREFQAEEEL